MKLKIKNLHKSFGKHHVLKGIDLDVQEGSFIAFLGPSGCGKTTLLRCIGGLEKIDQGQIILDGQDISHQSAQERNISTVFQSYGLFPQMNVFDNVAYGLKIQGMKAEERKERVEKMIEMVELDDFIYQDVQSLSGGQQQRVALARSLAIEPSLLLLDEPFSSLDRNLKSSLRQQIKDLQKKINLTTIIVTHDQEEAFALADQVAVMKEGQFVEINSPAALYESPQDPFVLEFIGESNRLTEKTYVRPEDIDLSLEAKSGYKSALVTEFSYLGLEVYLTIKNEEEELRVVSLSNQLPLLEVGDQIYYSYQAKRLGD